MPENCDFKRSPCPIANVLDLIGDRWSLVILRDLFLGKRRYGDFTRSPEKIPTNLLAERLKRLQREGLIDKVAYQQQPPRYEYHLTAKGRDTRPILEAMARWGNRYIPGTFVPPDDFWQQPDPTGGEG
ncbi:winged helix-turn-helix transcriptional regulator [Motiliproteus sediminis]|uniref:winged helix-turn-helix transcriptional regulator n=1 Tax=Motiliproteus sediminis TaxID=1468178 RepID=UPI001AEFDA00|nr:helix-turn-helix domain-containing protein [Motiliproteus sediminis]